MSILFRPSALPLSIESQTLILPLLTCSVKIDGEGLLPEDFDRILANWDEQKEGRRRPRVLYTVPTGQNPTGGTMLAERKQKIYDLCVKYGKPVDPLLYVQKLELMLI